VRDVLVVLPERIAGVPDDPTRFFVDGRRPPTAAGALTMEVRHYIAISRTYPACKLSRPPPATNHANKGKWHFDPLGSMRDPVRI
jgi:hypothetical protein